MENKFSKFGVTLTREEAKQIKGGSGSCAINVQYTNGTRVIGHGMSRESVDNAIAFHVGRDDVSRIFWCCASCDQATWLG